MILFIALVIKSASAVGFALGAFAIMNFRSKVSLESALSIALFTVSAFVFVAFVLPDLGGGRVGALVSVIGSMKLNSEMLFYIANESGNRLLALYSFFVSGFLNPFGFGVGSWPYSSMLALEQSGLDYQDFRFF